MKNLPNKYVDLIIADPPYFEVVKEKWDNQWNTEEEYLSWCEQWILESKRIIKNSGSFYCYMKPQFIHKIIPIIEKYFLVQNLIVVNVRKSRNIPKNRLRLHWQALILAVIKEKNNVFNMQYKPVPEHLIKRYTKIGYDVERGQPIDDIWVDIFPASNNNIYHPSRKADDLCERIVKLSSDEDNLVYIPFAGSGSEMESCIRNNRNYLATETNKQYIDEIIIPRIRIVK